MDKVYAVKLVFVWALYNCTGEFLKAINENLKEKWAFLFVGAANLH